MTWIYIGIDILAFIAPFIFWMYTRNRAKRIDREWHEKQKRWIHSHRLS